MIKPQRKLARDVEKAVVSQLTANATAATTQRKGAAPRGGPASKTLVAQARAGVDKIRSGGKAALEDAVRGHIPYLIEAVSEQVGGDRVAEEGGCAVFSDGSMPWAVGMNP